MYKSLGSWHDGRLCSGLIDENSWSIRVRTCSQLQSGVNPPKTLGLGWFFKSYDRGFFSGHKCWVDHGYIRIVGASTILLATIGTTLYRSTCSWRRCWRWPASQHWRRQEIFIISVFGWGSNLGGGPLNPFDFRENKVFQSMLEGNFGRYSAHLLMLLLRHCDDGCDRSQKRPALGEGRNQIPTNWILILF